MTDEGADSLVLRADCFKRLGDTGSGREIAVIDPALEFDERHHGHHSLRRPDKFYGPSQDGASRPSPTSTHL
jgi:hypothetical protein